MAKLKPYSELGPGGVRFTLAPRNDGDTYYLRFTHPRTRKQSPRINTKCNLLGEAKTFASQYLQEFVVNRNDPTKLTVGDVMKSYIENQDERNAKEVQATWDNRMGPIFGPVLANDVKTTDIRDYKRHCAGHKVTGGLFQGAQPYRKSLKRGTINRDLASLRAAFRYAHKAGLISQLPCFEIDDNRKARRRGFLQQVDFDKVMTLNMPTWLRAFLVVLYAVGIRVSEARGITVGQVDFINKILRLEETKNGDPRNPPLTNRMYQLLLACADGKSKSDLLFAQESGLVMNIWSIEDKWNALVAESGIERRYLHDFRRSAVRNMVSRGVAERTAMLISGHLTRWVFDGYNVIDERTMRKAGEAIDAGAELERQEALLLQKLQAARLKLGLDTEATDQEGAIQ